MPAAKINHTEGAAVGFSLKVSRNEQDATMKLDVSRYAGKNVTITAYVMAEDKKIRMGLETDADTQLLEVDAVPEDWAELSVNYTLPEDAPAAYIYIETDGKADYYVDDISVVINEDGAAVEEAGEDSANTGAADDASGTSDETEEGADSNASGNVDSASVNKGMFAPIAVVAVILIAAGTAGAVWFARKSKNKNSK